MSKIKNTQFGELFANFTDNLLEVSAFLSERQQKFTEVVF